MGFFIQFFAEFVVLRAFRFLTKDILYLLWFLNRKGPKRANFQNLNGFFQAILVHLLEKCSSLWVIYDSINKHTFSYFKKGPKFKKFAYLQGIQIFLFFI